LIIRTISGGGSLAGASLSIGKLRMASDYDYLRDSEGEFALIETIKVSYNQ
jgi:hypothetical protein